ncbi:MAG: long-chain fatty acid--CoA ligase [Flavobacteriaceae bacterium]|nr:long-chain fatty acid--CoA ligase [Flavobacteriaceae bacterium]
MAVLRLFDIVYHSLEKHPKDCVLATKYNGVWEKLSTQQFVERGNQLSRGLIKLGISSGDKIALVSTNNRTEWCIADLGISQVGAITVPVYPTISVEDYIYIFKDAEIKYCFVSDENLYEKLVKVKEEVSSLVQIFTFDKIEGASHWEEILDLEENPSIQQEVENRKNQIKTDDIATLIYTSGTTGKPKGVMLTHQNMLSNLSAVKPRIPMPKGEQEEIRSLSFLPICHVFERIVYYFYLQNGFSTYFAESIEKIGDNMKEVKPHYITVVPRLLEKVYDKIYNKGVSSGMLKKWIFLWALGVNKKYGLQKPQNWKQKLADKLVFSKWRAGLGGEIITLISGSAPLSINLNKKFQGAGIPIIEGYGLTETSPVISVNSFEDMKLGSVGKPLDNLDVKIATDGEILVKGPSVTKGYFKNEEQTQEAFTEDGYFKTGDIGHIDEEGFLIITDRKKEMFKTSGGKYIAPQMIENKAKASRFIEQIMVVGDGEKMPCALVQPDFAFVKRWAEIHRLDIGKTPAEIAKSPELKKRIEKEIAKLNEKLGNWEQVKKIELTPEIWSIENGMLTPTMKLRRKIIKERYIDLYNKLYDKEAF